MPSRWHVFLSYASEDRDIVARPIFELLTQRNLRVWIDEHELHVGDSLKEKIEHGLTNSRFGIVVLSKNFLDKKWTKRELNAIFSLEERTKKKLLPIWHDVDYEDIAKHSPLLADRVGIKTHTGFRNVCEAILSAMRSEHRALATALRRAELAKLAAAKQPRAPKKLQMTSAAAYFSETISCLNIPASTLPCYMQQLQSKTAAARIADALAAMRYFVEAVLRKHKSSHFLLVGINRGGSTIATYLAQRLKFSRDHLFTIDYLSNWEIPMAGSRPPLAAVDLIILIDDIARSGRTLQAVRNIVAGDFPKASIYATTLNVRPEALTHSSPEGDQGKLVDYSPIVGYTAHDDLPWNVGSSRDVFAYLSEAMIRKAESRFQ